VEVAGIGVKFLNSQSSLRTSSPSSHVTKRDIAPLFNSRRKQSSLLSPLPSKKQKAPLRTLMFLVDGALWRTLELNLPKNMEMLRFLMLL